MAFMIHGFMVLSNESVALCSGSCSSAFISILDLHASITYFLSDVVFRSRWRVLTTEGHVFWIAPSIFMLIMSFDQLGA
jgi:hypothetical protein